MASPGLGHAQVLLRFLCRRKTPGLTAEAHGTFWREVLSSSANLFAHAADSSGATVLPRRGADAEALRRTGRMLCKSLLDDHPIGAGLCVA